jgi:hypothetical protein
MINILVTGTGRSGTGYMSRLLMSAGLPCGHEEIISFLVNLVRLLNQDEKIGESSWHAAPLLHLPFFNDTTIIHAVRHPLNVIQSLRGIKFFIDKDLHYWYVVYFLPKLKNLSSDKAPFYFFIEWTKLILKYESDQRYIRHKVEDDPVSLVERLGGETSNLFSDTKYNTRWEDEKPTILTPEEIPAEYKTEFLEIAERTGYKLV